jgi:hypothetical protein
MFTTSGAHSCCGLYRETMFFLRHATTLLGLSNAIPRYRGGMASDNENGSTPAWTARNDFDDGFIPRRQKKIIIARNVHGCRARLMTL